MEGHGRSWRVMEGQERSWKVIVCHGRSYPKNRCLNNVKKVMGGGWPVGL